VNLTLTRGADERGRPCFDVYRGATFRLDERGAATLLDDDYAPVDAIELYDDVLYPGVYRPSLLRRDRDLQPRRRGTDVVVQGIWRAAEGRPVREAICALECRGAASFTQAIHIFGDRWVERGRAGPRFSAPEPVTEVPIRYDRAYGGTDEAAAARRPDPLEEALRGLVDDATFLEFSTYSYPRNHAGRGYLVDREGLIGAPLPNLEWRGEELGVDDLIAPLDAWGRRPLPAAFDWYNHAWFPRVAFFDDPPPTAAMRAPSRELELGIVDPEIMVRAPLDRPCDAFFQGAHPLLWRHRLRGDERIDVSGMSPDGRPTTALLPRLRPEIDVQIDGRPLGRQRALLDLVLLDTETATLTLLWRARLLIDEAALALRPTLNAKLDARWIDCDD
jgi:hypothetical protein